MRPRTLTSTSRGTLILAVTTNHGTYLAADSCSTNPRTNTAQKLFRCGGTAFIALCGQLIIRAALPAIKAERKVAVLDIMAGLDQISTEYPGGQGLVEYTAARCFTTLRSFWKLYVDPAPAAFLASAHAKKKVVCTIPVVSRRGSSTMVHEIQFPFSASGNLLDPTWKRRNEEVIGWGQVPAGAEDIPHYSDSAESVLAYIDAMYKHAALHYPESIGGDTDIGLVDTDGARWIRRKLVFPESPTH